MILTWKINYLRISENQTANTELIQLKEVERSSMFLDFVVACIYVIML